MMAASSVVEKVYTSALFRRTQVPRVFAESQPTELLMEVIAQSLGFPHDFAGDPVMSRRVQEYYTPIALYLLWQKSIFPHTLIVGLSLPQGGGKTTLSNCMKDVCRAVNICVETVSIDDFYLPHSELQDLARAHPDNIYMQGRGVAGTHDVKLGLETIHRLCNTSSGTVKVPRYDKSKYRGLGDRSPTSEWSIVSAPVDIILFEGWSFGFTPLATDDPDLLRFPGMEVVNAELAGYMAWYSCCNVAIVVTAKPQYVFEWREEAEVERRASGCGMSSEEVQSFCERFMPSYELYGAKLAEEGIEGVEHCLSFHLDRERCPFFVDK